MIKSTKEYARTKKEKIVSVRDKMVKSGLATLAVSGLIGTSVLSNPKNAIASCRSCTNCKTCPGECSFCSTCETCQTGKSPVPI